MYSWYFRYGNHFFVCYNPANHSNCAQRAELQQIPNVHVAGNSPVINGHGEFRDPPLVITVAD
jgi:hypothetical protein